MHHLVRNLPQNEEHSKISLKYLMQTLRVVPEKFDVSTVYDPFTEFRSPSHQYKYICYVLNGNFPITNAPFGKKPPTVKEHSKV